MCLVVDDFNNDHQADIAMINSGFNTLAVFLGDGHGAFSNAITSVTDSSSPSSIYLGVSTMILN